MTPLKDSLHNENNSGKHQFILFVSGMSIKSGYAVENVRKICDKYLSEKYDLKIIDINSDKQMAVDYQIIGIPTLIRLAPNPRRIILGDLSDTPKVLKILDIAE
jgi:circadian clock protein KaiB